jgi:hypothetical protein
MKQDKKIILKVLTGSRAHGLNDSDSDYDYRAVYVLPTSKILSLGYNYKGTHWIEGEKEDNTAYEVGHFLNLAIHCNPTILEIFKAPVIKATKEGEELRKLFPYVWNPQQAFDAFVGYGKNQRKKFLDKKDNRHDKYAVAYVRVLHQLNELLATGDFSVEITLPALKEQLLKFRKGKYLPGEIIDITENLIRMAEKRLPYCRNKPDLRKVNKFLLKVRRRYW